MTLAERGPRSAAGAIVSAVLVAIAAAALVGLGVWQVRRLHWKEDLIARIAAARTAQPVPIDRLLASRQDVAFRRAILECGDLERRPYLKLFSVLDGHAGFRVIVSCPLEGGAYGSVLVDRGFVDEDRGEQFAALVGRPDVGPETGVLRLPDPKTFVTPPNDPGAGLWYARDTQAMSARLGGARPLPYFFMLDGPASAPGGPVLAPLPVNLPNNHLQYAVTWFGLAAALVGVYVATLFKRRSV